MSESTRNWWANSPAAPRRVAIGAIVLVLGLSAASAAVWATPQGPAAPPPLEGQLAASEAENAALRDKLEKTESDLERARRATPAPTRSASPSPTPAPTSPPAPVPQPKPPIAPDPDPIVIYRSVESTDESQPAPPQPAAPAPAAPRPAAPTAKPVTPSLSAIVQPASRYFGMYTTQAPYSFATFDDASMKAGSRQNMVGYFSGWDRDFRADAVEKSWARGLLPVLTWESRPMLAPNSQAVDPDYSLPRILGDVEAGVPGAFDDYLRKFARDIVATGLPMGLRLNHEMNGGWYPWGETQFGGGALNGNRPGDYAKVWRHVHDIFEEEGANAYVLWIWAPNIVNNLSDRQKRLSYTQSLYPGDEYVDWVGLSGYLRPPYRTGNDYTFDYIFGQSLAQLRQITDKPILLAEVGASEVGGHKPGYIADFFRALGRPENADIVGFAWFNLTVTTVSGGERVTNDWRIESRADSLQAFGRGLSDPAAGFVLRPY